MRQQGIGSKGEISPTDRSDKMNGWIDWAVSARSDDPALLASALEEWGSHWRTGWACRIDRHGAVGSPAAPAEMQASGEIRLPIDTNGIGVRVES